MSKTSDSASRAGRLRRAPENFIDGTLAGDIAREGLNPTRRSFLQRSFLAAGAALAGGSAFAADAPNAVGAGDPMILEPRPWATSLG